MEVAGEDRPHALARGVAGGRRVLRPRPAHLEWQPAEAEERRLRRSHTLGERASHNRIPAQPQREQADRAHVQPRRRIARRVDRCHQHAQDDEQAPGRPRSEGQRRDRDERPHRRDRAVARRGRPALHRSKMRAAARGRRAPAGQGQSSPRSAISASVSRPGYTAGTSTRAASSRPSSIKSRARPPPAFETATSAGSLRPGEGCASNVTALRAAIATRSRSPSPRRRSPRAWSPPTSPVMTVARATTRGTASARKQDLEDP